MWHIMPSILRNQVHDRYATYIIYIFQPLSLTLQLFHTVRKHEYVDAMLGIFSTVVDTGFICGYYQHYQVQAVVQHIVFSNQKMISAVQQKILGPFPFQRGSVCLLAVIKMQWFGARIHTRSLWGGGFAGRERARGTVCRRLTPACVYKCTYNFVQMFMPVHALLRRACLLAKTISRQSQFAFFLTFLLWCLSIATAAL